MCFFGQTLDSGFICARIERLRDAYEAAVDNEREENYGLNEEDSHHDEDDVLECGVCFKEIEKEEGGFDCEDCGEVFCSESCDRQHVCESNVMAVDVDSSTRLKVAENTDAD